MESRRVFSWLNSTIRFIIMLRDGLTWSNTLSPNLWSLSHLPGYGVFVAHCLCATQWLWVPCTARRWGLEQQNTFLLSCEWKKVEGYMKFAIKTVNGFQRVVRWSTYYIMYTPPKQTWNLKMDPWKRRFLLETTISRFHVNFWGCIYIFNLNTFWFRFATVFRCQSAGQSGSLQRDHDEAPPSSDFSWGIGICGINH